jgi:ABC-2 type transport system ATP-binding protein
VELRRDMWTMVRALRATGVTIILTTHYIDEAEEMADRIGVINKGELILVEGKAELMEKLGRRQLTLQLQAPLDRVPETMSAYPLELSADGLQLV